MENIKTWMNLQKKSLVLQPVFSSPNSFHLPVCICPLHLSCLSLPVLPDLWHSPCLASASAFSSWWPPWLISWVSASSRGERGELVQRVEAETDKAECTAERRLESSPEELWSFLETSLKSLGEWRPPALIRPAEWAQHLTLWFCPCLGGSESSFSSYTLKDLRSGLFKCPGKTTDVH